MTTQRVIPDEVQINKMLKNVEVNNDYYWYIEIFQSHLRINVIEDHSCVYITSLEHYEYMNNLLKEQKVCEAKIEDKSIIIKYKCSEKNTYFHLGFEIAKKLVKEDIRVMTDLG